MKTIYVLIFVFFLSLLGLETKAQDFVFTFVNPAFGGNPYNYSWLLESADKQNKYDDEEEEEEESSLFGDPLEEFQSDLGRSIVSSLSDRINTSVLGENQDLSPGSYEVGNYNIRITEKSNGLNISITDQLTGNSTNMFIPTSATTTNTN